MDRIAVIGLSLTEGAVEDLEALRSSGQELRGLADDLAASELVLLATCNRFEVFYAREAGQPPSRADRQAVAESLGLNAETAAKLRYASGRDALQHLFRVASSLDSLVQGEDQILAQVRAAYGEAESAGLVGAMLASTFEYAFQVGKQVRTKTELSRHPVSVMSLGVQAVVELLSSARGETPPRVAVLGAGETARHAIKALEDEGVGVDLIANRTVERARDLLTNQNGRAVSLDSFLEAPEPVDVLIATVGAPGVLLDAAALRNLARQAPLGRGLIALDLALPRDLEHTDDPAVEVIGLEALRERADANRARRAQAARRAEDLVEERLKAFERRDAEKRFAERIETHVAQSNEFFETSLERLLRDVFGDLDTPERASVVRWAKTTFGRLNHLSTSTCKDLARAVSLGDEIMDGVAWEDEEETTG